MRTYHERKICSRPSLAFECEITKKKEKKSWCTHIEKTLLTTLSINKDLLIQIFDNQSSERRWKCWLYIYISHRQAIAQWWHWIKITHNKIHYSALSLQPVCSLSYISLTRSTTIYINLYIRLDNGSKGVSTRNW